MQISGSQFDSLLVATRVRELMEQHGLNERKQSSRLAKILEMSYSEAHRKMQGKGIWTITHLRKVAEAFGESAGSLIESFDVDSLQHRTSCQDATFVVGSREFACLAWIGGELPKGYQQTELVAVNIESEWRVYDTVNAPPMTHYTIDKIEIRQRMMNRLMIAVVDDEHDSADTVRDYLAEEGYTAAAFYNPQSLLDAMRETSFDAYVIDWLLGNQTAEGLVRHIRSVDMRKTPIMLLTGKLVSCEADQSELARAMVRFDLLWHEKPAKQAIMVAELKRVLV